MFLGIFEESKRKLVGTINFEPIDSMSNTAEIGMLIGEADYRVEALDVLSYPLPLHG